MVAKGCACTYRYGAVAVEPTEFPPWMEQVMQAVMPCCGLAAREQWPNACNVNVYEDGGMSVGWHTDDEVLFQGKFRDCLIISLSLGATRAFEVKLTWPESESEQEKWRLP